MLIISIGILYYRYCCKWYFKIPISSYSLLFIEIVDFQIFILSCDSDKLISSGKFLVDALGFSMYTNVSPVNKTHLFLSKGVGMRSYFPHKTVVWMLLSWVLFHILNQRYYCLLGMIYFSKFIHFKLMLFKVTLYIWP